MATARTGDRLLDFVVIGAQKAGTTTLFEHLRHHPGLYLPPSKEAPFFTRPGLCSQGTGALLARFYADAPSVAKLGKVTPDYMADRAVPERLASAFPNIRLVAILRDPVHRAHSEYLMQLRRRIEFRTFEQAVEELLEPDALSTARGVVGDTTGYVVRGEYGRILSEYLRFFAQDQLLVLFTNDLADSPGDVLRRTHAHLGVEYLEPPSLGDRFFEGGGKQRLPGLVPRAKRSRALRRLWHLFPASTRDLMFHRFERWNTPAPVGSAGSPVVLPSTEASLRDHFRSDGIRLEQHLGLDCPWPQ